MKNRKLALFLSLSMALFLLIPSLAKKPAKAKVSGEQAFKQYCASCHAGGGNSVNPKCPVAGSKQLASLALFKSYLSEPPGHMPYYQSVVTNPELLSALHKYCQSLPKLPIKQVMTGVDKELAVLLDHSGQ